MNRFIVSLILCGFYHLSYSQCTPTGTPTVYGTSNVWRGYVYDNADFTTYRGYVLQGNAGSPDFDQSFGGSNTTYNTTSCSVTTETFSVRYRLTKHFQTAVMISLSAAMMDIA